MEYVVIGLVLIILGILFDKWKPPLLPQYQFILLAISSLIVGYLTGVNLIYCFCIAGLVFYKKTLLDEIRMVKEVVLETKQEISETVERE